jgi:hypothetical protein
MTSSERKRARYERRKQKREEKRITYKEKYDDFERVSNTGFILIAEPQAEKGIAWKTSPQRYDMDLVPNVIKASDDLRNDVDIRKGFITFTLIERGKARSITSVHFSERVIQKALTQNVLIPILGRNLIYDNGACLKNKGYTFSVNRLKQHLTDYYNKHGSNEGYVLLLDLHNYFGSIPHQQLKERIMNEIDDPKVLRLACDFIDSFEGETGLGLGSETCQIEAVFYPNPIDHLVKDRYGYRGYSRYNDDSYVIGETREELEEIRDVLIDEYSKLGLELNKDKTKIVKLDSKEFKFLKNKVKLDENGKVVLRPVRKSIVNMRRKLKKFKHLYDTGEMTFEQVNTSYQSWRGSMARKQAYFAIKDLDDYFYQNFTVPDRKRKMNENKEKLRKANRNSKRRKKKQKELENTLHKDNSPIIQVPTIESETNDYDKEIDAQIRQCSIMTNMIGREETHNYKSTQKKKYKRHNHNRARKTEDQPGRKRMANKLKEKKVDSRMTYQEVQQLKEDVDNKKLKKQQEIKASYTDKNSNTKPKTVKQYSKKKTQQKKAV